MVEYRITVAAG